MVAVNLLEPPAKEKTLASATGTRKKHAEQEAARLALLSLRSSQGAEQSPLPEKLASVAVAPEGPTAGKRK